MYCPSIRASDVETHVDSAVFILHANPYFLRLTFSHSVLEDDDSSATYDPSSGYLTVTLTKAIKGEEFRDLDLLAKLLAPRRNSQHYPTIEVLSSETEDDALVHQTTGLSLDDQAILQAAASDWQLPQSVPEASTPLKIAPNVQYGFLDMYTGYFNAVAHTENEINELGPAVEGCLPAHRRAMRKAREEAKWDEEHYMADFADDEFIQELIAWKYPHPPETDLIEFTEDENAVALRLPRKEYLASPSQTHNLYLTLVTILFSYAYESRTNQCDPNPESAWTICSLTPAFSALDPPPYREPATPVTADLSASDIQATLSESYRRSLTFPLYRSFALAEACKEDISKWFLIGKRMVFRCLLNVKHILDHHEVYYVYSKVWVDDFCVWVQTYASDDVFAQLGRLLRGLAMPKALIGWDLEGLEKATQDVHQRESDSDDESSSDDPEL